jgi:hypothetical protein
MTAAQAEASARAAPDRIVALFAASEQRLREAADAIQAGTRLLDDLSVLLRSWEDLARSGGDPAAAAAVRRCAGDLRLTVLRAHGPGEKSPAGTAGTCTARPPAQASAGI